MVSALLVATLAIGGWERLSGPGAIALGLAWAVVYAIGAGLAGQRSRAGIPLTSALAFMIAFGGAMALQLKNADFALAQATRTWVSGVGDDANPCSRTAPCKTFPGAISKTASGGEINVLDPGGFGGITINKAITISAEDVEGGVLVSGTNAIVVNAGAADSVVLRGLDIEGLGTGLNGIRFISGGALHVEDSTINNFTQEGIDFAPSASASLLVKDTILRKNTDQGIYVHPSGGTSNASLDGVRLERNGVGLRVDRSGEVSVRDSEIANNVNQGVLIASSSTNAVANIAGSSIVNSGGTGVRATGSAAKARLFDNFIAQNNRGLDVLNGGTIASFGNNGVGGNGVDGAPTSTIPLE
jgi:hypothetical protein